MNFLTENHTMDLLYLLIVNFKNLLFDLLIIGRSFENLSIYQVARYQKDEDSEEYARTYYEAMNTLLPQRYREWLPNTFYDLEAYGTQQEVVRLKISEIFH